MISYLLILILNMMLILPLFILKCVSYRWRWATHDQPTWSELCRLASGRAKQSTPFIFCIISMDVGEYTLRFAFSFNFSYFIRGMVGSRNSREQYRTTISETSIELSCPHSSFTPCIRQVVGKWEPRCIINDIFAHLPQKEKS